MKIIFVRNIKSFAQQIRPKPSIQNKKTVESIISQVQKKGDSALKQYEKKFSGATLDSLRITKKEVEYAYSQVSKNEITAIKTAKTRLSKTENAVREKLKDIKINIDGIKISKSFIPINSVGCYVPGGIARYPSSVVMSVVPAKIAGVKKIIVVSPPNKQGNIDPLTLVAADICGASEIFKTGGAQAIAALSFGTKSIPQVDKIVGPGGSFVALAKSAISEKTSIDMIAGPTELGIIADDDANPELVAIDLLSQAEHSEDTFCYVITTSKKLATKTQIAVNQMINNSPRKQIIKKSLEKNGFIAVCKNQKDEILLANILAPEHLEIITKNPKEISDKINSAGLVLIGKNSPSSASDYLLGSNHILPTNGFGKVRGSLSVLDFVKLGTKLEASEKALFKISKQLYALTTAEGLPNHYKAVRSRLK
jgi:histidinol dehydrogenase